MSAKPAPWLGFLPAAVCAGKGPACSNWGEKALLWLLGAWERRGALDRPPVFEASSFRLRIKERLPAALIMKKKNKSVCAFLFLLLLFFGVVTRLIKRLIVRV